jgi:uncharacterized protein
MPKLHHSQPILHLPVGTQVVTRAPVVGHDGSVAQPRGAVGVILAAPSAAGQRYTVRFADGGTALLGREALAVRKQFQQSETPLLLLEADLDQYVIYRCVVGSQAYGLADAGSDVDRRGIYLPPADLHWGLSGVPEQIEHTEQQECYWELQKFLTLALKANPNLLECLYTPRVETATPLAEELLQQRAIFLSQLVYQTYNGYVLSQFKKLEQDLRTRGEIRWKHAMHLLRLLLAGTAVLREGLVLLDVGEHRARLLAVKRGELPWAEVDAWRRELHRSFDAAFASTRLPERPDYAAANAFLLRARRAMI